MSRVEKLVAAFRESRTNVRYSDLLSVCAHYFGESRHGSTSHAVFRTPWHGEPRVNIQNKNGQAKPYQVKQVLEAIDKLNSTGKENC
ncbi:toxin HicA [Mycobacterium sp. SA01]|uniref:toxin HicA n=1 Tax=Mycobacterium sp. SA01 TaxID=3238820 RepID=UPI00351B5E2C